MQNKHVKNKNSKFRRLRIVLKTECRKYPIEQRVISEKRNQYKIVFLIELLRRKIPD